MSKKKAEGDAAEAQPDPPPPRAADLLGGLEELLQEEGFAASDADAGEGAADLLADTQQPPPPARAAQPEARAAPRQRPDTRSVRASRRTRDQQDFRSLDTQIHLDPIGLEIAEDRLTATVTRLSPAATPEEVLQLMAAAGVVAGIDHEAIRGALARAGRGQPVSGVVVARGHPPRVVEPARVAYHVPPSAATPPSGGRATDLERLKELIEGPQPEAFHSYKGRVRVVRPGDVIAQIVPAHVEPGQDVCGQRLEPAAVDSIQLQAGDHTEVAEDGTQVRALLYGFAGLVHGVPTVVPPIWVSPDHMQARFVYVASPDPIPAPSPEELAQLLHALWIEHGVLEKQVSLVQKRLAHGQALSPTLLVAQGAAEVPGEPAQVRHAFDLPSALPPQQLQTLWSLPTPEAFEQALSELHAAADGPRLFAFRPGEVVAEKVPATEGVPGKDVRGEEIIPREGQDVELQVGENVVLSDDGLRATADCFGLACVRREGQVVVLPPIWLSPDRMTAYYVNLPQAAPVQHPAVEEVEELLRRAQVTHGFSAEAWRQRLQALQAGTHSGWLVPAAEGTRPQPGQDGTFEWAIEMSDRRPGTMQEDGTIDFRERNLTTVVKKDDLIGRLVPPCVGTPGCTVLGTPVLPLSGTVSIEVVTDAKIRAENVEDGCICFYAVIGGGVSRDVRASDSRKRAQQRIHLGILPISSIEHDVDYSTGNIDFNGDVLIGGSVHPQFAVRATGSVTVNGFVEAGAYITAGTDILVKRGVMGASTQMVAGRDVMAKYIQEATVRAGRDVRVGSYIFNASVRAGGQVVVPGRGEGKSRALVGGLVWGARGIAGRSVGSPYNTSTRLVAGVDPESVARADQIRANMQACEEKQRKLLRTIGVESMDLEVIRQKLARCRSTEERQAVLSCVRRVARVAALQGNLQKELSAIADSQQELALTAQVSVQQQIFAGVALRLGEETLTLQDDLTKVSFRLVRQEEELSIQVAPFAGSLR